MQNQSIDLNICCIPAHTHAYQLHIWVMPSLLAHLQVAGGNGEQVISRDVYRLGTQFDFFRLMAWCVTCACHGLAQHLFCARCDMGQLVHTTFQQASMRHMFDAVEWA